MVKRAGQELRAAEKAGKAELAFAGLGGDVSGGSAAFKRGLESARLALTSQDTRKKLLEHTRKLSDLSTTYFSLAAPTALSDARKAQNKTKQGQAGGGEGGDSKLRGGDGGGGGGGGLGGSEYSAGGGGGGHGRIHAGGADAVQNPGGQQCCADLLDVEEQADGDGKQHGDGGRRRDEHPQSIFSHVRLAVMPSAWVQSLLRRSPVHSPGQRDKPAIFKLVIIVIIVIFKLVILVLFKFICIIVIFKFIILVLFKFVAVRPVQRPDECRKSTP
jgi:hypothetical protein